MKKFQLYAGFAALSTAVVLLATPVVAQQCASLDQRAVHALAADAIAMIGDPQRRMAVTQKYEIMPLPQPDNLPDEAELRASIAPGQEWRLAILLADKAVLAMTDDTYVERIAEAQAIAVGIKAEGIRDWLLAEIVTRRAAVGDIGGARDSARTIRHPGWRADALIAIALVTPMEVYATPTVAMLSSTNPAARDENQDKTDRSAAICAALNIPDHEWRASALLDLDNPAIW